MSTLTILSIIYFVLGKNFENISQIKGSHRRHVYNLLLRKNINIIFAGTYIVHLRMPNSNRSPAFAITPEAKLRFNPAVIYALILSIFFKELLSFVTCRPYINPLKTGFILNNI
jgi:hypothetical protein